MIVKLLRAYLASFAGLPKAAWLLALVIFINRCGSMVLFFMSLYFTRSLGLSVSLTGFLITVFGLGSLIGSYLGGWLADRLGTFIVQFISLLAGGGLYLIAGHLQSVESLAVTLFLLGVLADAFRPANVTAFTEICPPEKLARGFALMRLAINLGITIGPALGGILAMRNYRLLFWVDGLTCIGAAALFWFLADSFQLSTAKEKKKQTDFCGSPWTDRLYLGFLSMLFVMGIVFFQVFNTWPLYLREDCLFPENYIGLLMGINALLVALIEMPIIHRIEKKKPMKYIMMGTVLLFAGFGLLPLSRHLIFIVFTVVLWTLGEVLIFPLAGTWISGRAPKHRVGSYMGLYTLTFSCAMMVSPSLCLGLMNHWGYTVLWISSGAAGLGVLLGLKLLTPAMNQKTG